MTDAVEANVESEFDILDEHGGSRVTLRGAYTLRLAGVSLSPELGVEWLSDATADHLYGVRTGEARPGRPAHAPGDAFNMLAGAGLRYSVTDAVALVGAAQWTWFAPAIRDSPIVVQDSVFSLFLALAYSL